MTRGLLRTWAQSLAVIAGVALIAPTTASALPSAGAVGVAKSLDSSKFVEQTAYWRGGGFHGGWRGGGWRGAGWRGGWGGWRGGYGWRRGYGWGWGGGLLGVGLGYGYPYYGCGGYYRP